MPCPRRPRLQCRTVGPAGGGPGSTGLVGKPSGGIFGTTIFANRGTRRQWPLRTGGRGGGVGRDVGVLRGPPRGPPSNGCGGVPPQTATAANGCGRHRQFCERRSPVPRHRTIPCRATRPNHPTPHHPTNCRRRLV